VIFPALSSCI